MAKRTLAISLKIPDNEAMTAQSALKRLGIEMSRLERAEIWHFDDAGPSETAAERFEQNESVFNPNKHVLSVLDGATPRAGEVWVEPLEGGDVPLRMDGASHARRYIGWRLFVEPKHPAGEALVRDAAEKLLHNPAIERAIYS